MCFFTLPETNSSHLRMDGWKISFLLGWPVFRGYVSFREGTGCSYHQFGDVGFFVCDFMMCKRQYRMCKL